MCDVTGDDVIVGEDDGCKMASEFLMKLETGGMLSMLGLPGGDVIPAGDVMAFCGMTSCVGDVGELW